MTQKEKQLYKAIDKILWENWDPIGVNDNEECRDEYQSYTPHIFSLVIRNADAFKIAKHLYQLETQSMGMLGSQRHCQEIAQKIIEMSQKIKKNNSDV